MSLHRSTNATNYAYPSKVKWLIPAVYVCPWVSHYLPPAVDEALENKELQEAPRDPCSAPSLQNKGALIYILAQST